MTKEKNKFCESECKQLHEKRNILIFQTQDYVEITFYDGDKRKGSCQIQY